MLDLPSLLPLSPRVLIRTRDATPLPAAVEARIAALWQARQAARQPEQILFNGPLYGLADYAPDRLLIERREYRQLIALRDDPTLAETLPLHPLGVTGVLICTDGVVLGRRGGGMALYPDHWETVPSGSLDQPDPAAVLLHECAEELGLPAEALSAPPQPCALITAGGISDLVYRLDTPWTLAAIIACWQKTPREEYTALTAVPEPMIDLLAPHPLLPTLPLILRAALGTGPS